MKLGRRAMIRLVSLTAAAIAALSARNIILMRENRNKDILISNGYVRALEDLSAAADNISSTLEKQLYASTPEQQSKLADKLFNEASSAKSAMLQLPVQELSLENTYKFLSQVGNYAQSIAKKSAGGEEISDDEYNNLKSLRKYAETLSSDLWSLEKSVSSGEINISDISNNDNTNYAEVTEGFTEFEESFESYPRLIYDGPFSDHIMEKEPQMLKDKNKVSKSKALERASMTLNVSANDLTNVTERGGDLPAWIFSDSENGVSCAVTKQGGMVSYFIKSRQPENVSLSMKEAVKNAEEYIANSSYDNMKVTYYEKQDNVVTVNFAYCIDGITCYTDLIKVSVALDNGEILGFEASGYIVNHQKRAFPDEEFSIRDCREKLSPMLKCIGENRALIPSDGGSEVYCYEYKCTSEDGRNVLVYFNAQTGVEEQILILLENESGTLTI